MKYLSLFSGIGGFELGIQYAYDLGTQSTNKESEQAEPEIQLRGVGSTMEVGSGVLSGYRRSRPVCIGFSEIDKYASSIYAKHFPYEQCEACRLRCLQSDNSEGPTELYNATDGLEQRKLPTNCQCEHTPYGDITKLNADTLPDFDLLVGGFPCQAFSIAGKRKGFDDTRGTLFFEIARILRAKQPRLFLLENVKGLLSHDNGKTFSTIIATLDELGYDLQWQVLNSKNHGVPQNRERVFIVGHLRGTSRPKVFPITNDGGQTDELPRHVSNTLTARYEGAQATGSYIANTISTGKTHTVGTYAGEGEQYAQEDIRIRRLTPTECERLQGFPDNWTAGVSDTQRYKMCGNAVTVNVIRDIVKHIDSSTNSVV